MGPLRTTSLVQDFFVAMMMFAGNHVILRMLCWFFQGLSRLLTRFANKVVLIFEIQLPQSVSCFYFDGKRLASQGCFSQMALVA